MIRYTHDGLDMEISDFGGWVRFKDARQAIQTLQDRIAELEAVVVALKTAETPTRDSDFLDAFLRRTR